MRTLCGTSVRAKAEAVRISWSVGCEAHREGEEESSKEGTYFVI